jgi:hypothetical protein
VLASTPGTNLAEDLEAAQTLAEGEAIFHEYEPNSRAVNRPTVGLIEESARSGRFCGTLGTGISALAERLERRHGRTPPKT